MREDKPLDQWNVSFTGRGMSFNRERAEQIVNQLGGSYLRRVNEHTSLLVIGAAGWPLQKNGRLTKNLETANRLRRMGCALQIEAEEDFLRRIGTDASSVERMYTLPTLSRLLKLSSQQLNAWRHIGLICPRTTVNGVSYYDFKQVVRCRTLAELSQSKTGSKRLYRALRQFRSLGVEDQSVLDRLQLYGSQLAIRDPDGNLHEPSGQQLLDFDSSGEAIIATLPAKYDVDFERAVAHELEGEFAQAESMYRQVLAADPDDSDVIYNLANVIVAQQRPGEAMGLYRQAVFLEPDFTEAWNNLGNAMIECGQPHEALIAYRQALQIDPHYSTAFYGLGRALEECGRSEEAKPFWRSYLHLEPQGQCASYAARRLQDS